MLIDNAGTPNVTASYRYDPFGNSISTTGTNAVNNVYRFSSKERHANSGMYYYGFRVYDPILQRWLNRDPLQEQGGLNLYRFASNAPTIEVDPYGEGCLLIIITILLIIGLIWLEIQEDLPHDEEPNPDPEHPKPNPRDPRNPRPP